MYCNFVRRADSVLNPLVTAFYGIRVEQRLSCAALTLIIVGILNKEGLNTQNFILSIVNSLNYLESTLQKKARRYIFKDKPQNILFDP